MNEQLYAKVSGSVQGVGFRQFVKLTAESMKLTGWVRNTWNDEVEVTAEGERTVLEQFLEQLRKGPRTAFVSSVEYDWQAASGEFRTFSVVATK